MYFAIYGSSIYHCNNSIFICSKKKMANRRRSLVKRPFKMEKNKIRNLQTQRQKKIDQLEKLYTDQAAAIEKIIKKNALNAHIQLRIMKKERRIYKKLVAANPRRFQKKGNKEPTSDEFKEALRIKKIHEKNRDRYVKKGTSFAKERLHNNFLV